MNNTTEQWFDYEKVLTETDILEIAKKIGETRKKIDEIEEARKTLKNLQQEKLTLERQLEQGKASGHFNGIHSYHDPEEGLVTISPNPKIDWRPNSFTPFTREMTQAEKEKYCQLSMDFEEPKEENREETIDDVAATVLDQIDYENYDSGTFVPDDEVESLTMRRTLRPLIPEGVRPNFVTCDENRFYREYYIKSLPTPNRPFVLWMYKLNSIGRVIESKGLAWGNEDELKAKLNVIMQKAGVNIGVLLREQTNLGIQITTENEELQEQEEAILNVDRDQIDVFRSAKDKRYFMFDDFGDRLYLTMERQSQSQIYFHDPAVPKGTILKNKKDILLVDQSENSQKEPTEETIVDEIPVYKSVKTGEYFLMDNEGERLLLIVSSQNSSIINFIDPFDNEEIILKRHEDIRLRDEELQEPIPNISVPVEPEQLSKVKVWKALNGGYYVFNEQQNPVPLKVLNSLENVVFLEQEGVDGVILKRHSEIIPSAINL